MVWASIYPRLFSLLFVLFFEVGFADHIILPRHSFQASVTAPDPGYKSISSSSVKHPSISNIQKQNILGFTPDNPFLIVMLALIQSRNVGISLPLFRPPQNMTGSQAYAGLTLGLKLANGFIHTPMRMSSGQ